MRKNTRNANAGQKYKTKAIIVNRVNGTLNTKKGDKMDDKQIKCFECRDEWGEEFMVEVDAAEQAFLCTSCFELEEIAGYKEAREMNRDFMRGAL